ncbi:lytic transglycosylase domain-containing protein [Candidatus Phycosocius spiralis]|uniref:Murein transglycosylase n=1 Tax=Candidatus Phycosocius spiralis TaxID=2815099 RepID=A0ABQ4PWM8_9PROT|nr:lytic transglycosylase domain-containing protein [Candidatus Phycosocius spiralis]GIU67407.1 murein transglycosylase [Candidatus Phycosocius spiralis]
MNLSYKRSFIMIRWMIGIMLSGIGVPFVALAQVNDPLGTSSAPPLDQATPSRGPAQPIPVSTPVAIIPSQAGQALKDGLNSAARGDWDRVRAIMNQTPDARVRAMLLWRLATSDTNAASFDELRQALDQLRFFPQRQAIRIRAEQSLAFTNLSVQVKRAFLQRQEQGLEMNGPISGEGKLELASALFTLGQTQEAKRWLSDGWRNHRLDRASQAAFLERLGNELTPQDHDARVDFLLWADRVTQSKPLWPLMSDNGRKTVERRLGIASGETVTLSGTMLDDRGILYQRVRALRLANRRSEALALLTQIDSTGVPEPGQDLIWAERRNLLNEAIVTKDWQAAYRIASTHGYTRGERFADGEFVAGWIALRFLNQPKTAMVHFTRLDAAVRTPVSKARANYWLGRTEEVMGQSDAAQRRYRTAALYPTYYYGQLAAIRLADLLSQTALLTLPPEKRATPQDRARLQARPMMAIINLLSEIGESQYFRQFASALDDELETEGEHQALSEYARAQDEPALAVRVAKAGLNRGILATEAAFPLMPVPRLVGYGQIEDAFTLAITRQESEFNSRAVSQANARGLMQFLPATAANQARKMGLEHNTAWLITRPSHNVTLGSAHLYDLVNNFSGSYVMAAAAYNAGPGRPRQWVQTYGELRETDLETAIDWVEKIPFAETRNYVQRVLENIQVYRARLNGGSALIGLADDLRRGKRPQPTFIVSIAPNAHKSGAMVPEDHPSGANPVNGEVSNENPAPAPPNQPN